MSDQEELMEVGVTYVPLKDDQEPPRLFMKCSYNIKHLPTGEETTGQVGVFNEIDALRLINHWNSGENWKYHLIECDGKVIP